MSHPPEKFPNIMTVDLEDWFHILEVEGGYTRDDWTSLDSRVVRNTERLLELFETASIRASFFVVGWVARRQPKLIQRVAEAGHELGSHSYWHEVLSCYDHKSLAADLEGSKKLLEDLSGQPVRGFRAPGGSITPRTAWAFDVLVEQGYEYDSSVCPGYSSHGGFPSSFYGPHRIRCEAGELFEIPAATLGLRNQRFPYAGGGYLRLLPYPALKTCVALDNRMGRPTNIYVHPREIDPDQPRMELSRWRSFKYYVGLNSTWSKVQNLLRDFRFVSAGDWLTLNEENLRDQIFDMRPFAAAQPPTTDPSQVPPHPSQDEGQLSPA